MKKIIFLSTILVVLTLVSKGFAGYYDSVSLATGLKFHARSDERINFMARWQHQIHIINCKPMEFVFSLEPAFLAFDGGQYGGAIGTVFESKFDVGSNVKLIVSYGAGVLLTTARLVDEALVFNFTPQGGVGIEYKENVFEVRYWHASNGGIRDPNGGIDDILFLVGVGI
ncbi:MAG: acyloxyacyl hydrolase [Patescibacteria group bacterium]|nr:acyloxyacyl hydrolase [Patescibacteria group bacterium]